MTPHRLLPVLLAAALALLAGACVTTGGTPADGLESSGSTTPAPAVPPAFAPARDLLEGLPPLPALPDDEEEKKRRRPGGALAQERPSLFLERQRWAREYAVGDEARAWLYGARLPSGWEQRPGARLPEVKPQPLPERPPAGPPCPGGPCPSSRPPLEERARLESERHFATGPTERPWRWDDRLRPPRRAY